MTPEEAKEVVGGFLADAKRRTLKEWELALYKIIHLPWWKCWQARDIANKALGTGKYWNAGFKHKGN